MPNILQGRNDWQCQNITLKLTVIPRCNWLSNIINIIHIYTNTQQQHLIYDKISFELSNCTEKKNTKILPKKTREIVNKYIKRFVILLPVLTVGKDIVFMLKIGAYEFARNYT